MATSTAAPSVVFASAAERPELVPLAARLEREGMRVVQARTPEDTRTLAEREVDVVVALHAPGPWAPAEALRDLAPRVPIILLAVEPVIEEALAAIRAGFVHYAAATIDHDELVRHIERARARRPRRAGPPSIEAPQIIGKSRALEELQGLLGRVAKSAASTILITGESGCGKDVLARSIHAHSTRAAGPFMNITCSAIPETLLESELFGHERGAFTDARDRKIGLLENADGGTVFLDEIGEMSPLLQAKLLRFLEEKAFRRVGGKDEIRPDVRVIAATNRDLLARVRAGQFRGDLYYRLAVVELWLPPLRDRLEDVEPLARHFIERFAAELRRPVRRISHEALRMLQRYPWPGNVRELRNTIERAVLLCDGVELLPEHIMLDLQRAARSLEPGFKLPEGGLVLRDLERKLLEQALELSRGNQTEAARLLGMSRDQVRYRVEKHDLLAGWRRREGEDPAADAAIERARQSDEGLLEPTDLMAPLPQAQLAPATAGEGGAIAA